MLAIGSRDEEGKKLGLVVDGSGRGGRRRGHMEKIGLAKGKACFGRDDDVDPDALSYLDEKIQHVLGHFQKEFEGGVSAESLGAKFGGYGSFLQIYPCSPSISLQHKSPAKTPSRNVSRSPYNLQSQDGLQNPSVLGTTPIPKVSAASGGQLAEKSDKNKTSISKHRSEGISQPFSMPVNISDKKMLKVRIKVGQDNDLPRNKPDIYSDLGLDVSPSPSPSMKDTPNGNEECSPESPDAFLESPTTILQIMTCFPVPDGYIHSPLRDSLQHSNGKEDTLLSNSKTRVLHERQTEACTSSEASLNLKFVNGSAGKKIKSGDNNQMLRETLGLPSTGDMMPFLMKETEAETPAAQKVIYNAHTRFGDAREERQINGSSAKEICNTAGNFKDPDKLLQKERISISNLSTDNLLGFVESRRNDFVGNSVKEDTHSNGETNCKSDLTIESYEERVGINQDSSCKLVKDLKNYNTAKADSKRYNSGRKNHAIEHEGLADRNPAKKAVLCEKNLLTTIQEIEQDYGGRVPKGSPINDIPFAEPARENLKNLSSVGPKRKHELSHESKLKAHKLHKKAMEGEAIESHKGPGVSTHIQKVNEKEHGFSSSRFIEKSKVQLGDRKADNLQIANSASDALSVAPSCKALTSDATATISASVIKENWVFCDLCQTWRLLPYGTNTDSLPKKWQCSMQIWLPGLNKCYISEEETTKAFHQLYQLLPPANGADLNVHSDAAVSGIASDDILNPNGRQENNTHGIPTGAKKKHGLPDASNLPNGSSLSHPTNPGKNLKDLSESRSLNNVMHYSLETDSSLKHRLPQKSRSADLTKEKYNNKIKEKPFKIPASCPNEGDLFGKGGKDSMLKSRRKADLDGHRSSKKIKKDGLHYSEKDVHAEDEILVKMAINGDCDLPPRAFTKVLGDYSSFKDIKSEVAPSKNSKEAVGTFSIGKHKERVAASDTEKMGKYDSKDKKRGLKELQVSRTRCNISVISKQLLENRPMIKDWSSEGEVRRKKKAKIAKSEGQDSSAIVDGKIDKNDNLTRIKLSTSKKYQPEKVDEGSIHPFECVDAMKRNATNLQLVAAATSSSSEVSGSRKIKVNAQGARESPLKSVSSSPTNLLNTQNNSTKVVLPTKDDDISPIGPSLKGSPKSIYNGDVDASDQSGTVLKYSASKSSNQKVDHLSQIIADRPEGGSRKAIQTCHSAKRKQEKIVWGFQTVPTFMKERNSEQYHVDAVDSEVSKSAKKLRKSEGRSEMHSNISSQPSPTMPDCSLMKKDGHITVNAFIQEARDLKHTASRLKNDGLEHESSGIFFEASLKFLHVASLMEPPNTEFVRQGELFPSKQMLKMYLDTAKFCEFCAREYENLKNLAAAALAYKCAEVAYMKVAYFKHPTSSKDRHELQAALNATLPGESPSSSTSDVDILNNQGSSEKATSTRATGSPQLAANYVIAARKRPHVKRLLTFTNHLNCAFEAANKSQNAIAAASIDLDKDRVESLFSVKRVLDFNFNNVEGLLQLVRFSLNSISR